MSTSLHTDAIAALRSFDPDDHQQRALRQAYLGFLLAEPAACRRDLDAGHLTASALLLDAKTQHALLTLHPLVGRWLQLGGHLEAGDHTLAGAAAREAAEESGIHGIRIDHRPLALDVHPITCRTERGAHRPSRHFDVQFLALAPADARPVLSAESLRLGWYPLTELAAGRCGPTDADDSVRALAAAARARLRSGDFDPAAGVRSPRP